MYSVSMMILLKAPSGHVRLAQLGASMEREVGHQDNSVCLSHAGKGAVYSYDAIGSHERSGYSVQVQRWPPIANRLPTLHTSPRPSHARQCNVGVLVVGFLFSRAILPAGF